jgi:hypothetical protein
VLSPQLPLVNIPNKKELANGNIIELKSKLIFGLGTEKAACKKKNLRWDTTKSS